MAQKEVTANYHLYLPNPPFILAAWRLRPCLAFRRDEALVPSALLSSEYGG